jgi:hypothetical protein
MELSGSRPAVLAGGRPEYRPHPCPAVPPDRRDVFPALAGAHESDLR